MSTNTELPHGLKLLALWGLVFIGVFLGVLGFQHHQEAARFQVNAGRILLQRGPDGHFHWRGEVNGVPTEFLVDTGATSTALPQALAEQAGLEREGTVQSQTAGGVVRGYRARADIALVGGVSAVRLPVTVLPDLAGPLLGMDLLGKLRFSQHDGVLSIEQP